MTMTKSQAGKLGAMKSSQTWSQRKKQNVELYLQNPKLCLVCHSTIPYEKRDNQFCGHVCSAKQNNNRKNTGKSKKNCTYCNLPLTTFSSSLHQKCKTLQFWERIKHDILNNNLTNVKDRHIKTYLLETTGHVCSMCNLSEWNNKPIPLQLDHIDGQAETNRSLSNCRLLCPNCHAQTPTFGAKNMGKGRKKRRDRYLKIDGLSR
jgi:hypothetical protein